MKASNLSLYTACPGSYRFTKDIPKTESAAQADFRKQGVLLHSAVECHLKKLKVPKLDNHTGVFNDTLELIEEFKGGSKKSFRSESRFFSPIVSSDVVVDGWLLDSDTSTLKVFDLKFGWNIVGAYYNYQLMLYAWEILRYETVDPPKHVELAIIQPRPYHIAGKLRTHTLSYEDLKDRIKQFENKILKEIKEGERFKTGSHCLTCPGFTKCAVAAENRNDYIGLAELSWALNVPQITFEENLSMLPAVEEAIGFLSTYKKNMEIEIEQKINAGEAVTGYHFKEGRGTRKWKDEQAAEVILGGELKTEAIRSPAQMEALGYSKRIIKELVEKQPGKLKLEKTSTAAIKRLFNYE